MSTIIFDSEAPPRLSQPLIVEEREQTNWCGRVWRLCRRSSYCTRSGAVFVSVTTIFAGGVVALGTMAAITKDDTAKTTYIVGCVVCAVITITFIRARECMLSGFVATS